MNVWILEQSFWTKLYSRFLYLRIVYSRCLYLRIVFLDKIFLYRYVSLNIAVIITFARQLKDLESQVGVAGSGSVGSGSVGSGAGGEAPSKEQVARLEKECKEQEELLARFQSENKRLYEEIRSKEKAAKATEEAMFKENQRLNAEMASLRLAMFGRFFIFFLFFLTFSVFLFQHHLLLLLSFVVSAD